jgi:hypothetical protein
MSKPHTALGVLISTEKFFDGLWPLFKQARGPPRLEENLNPTTLKIFKGHKENENETRKPSPQITERETEVFRRAAFAPVEGEL